MRTLAAVGAAADVVEIGVPFSDPMADGLTIQRSSRVALEAGVSLRWLLELLAGSERTFAAPLLLMSYMNPLLAYGLDELPRSAREAGISGFIVPDLPLEESAELGRALRRKASRSCSSWPRRRRPERAATLCDGERRIRLRR